MRTKFATSMAAATVLLVNVASADGPSRLEQSSVGVAENLRQVKSPPITLADGIIYSIRRPLIAVA